MNCRTRLIALLTACLLGIGSPAAAIPTREIWDLDQVIYSTPRDSGILDEVMKTHSNDALIAVLENHHIQFQRQKRQLDPASLPASVYAQIVALPPGEPFIASDGSRSAASSIVGRESKPADDQN